MTTTWRPAAGCRVCQRPIEKLDGFVACLDLGLLHRLLATHGGASDALRSDLGAFINAATMECMTQVPDAFERSTGEPVTSLGEWATNKEIDANAHRHRLERVLAVEPRTRIYILLHEGCIPPAAEEELDYWIELSRFDTHAKGIEWTIHLGEKVDFNATGWIRALGQLFGRIHC